MEGTLTTSVVSQLPTDCRKKLDGYAKAIAKAKARGVEALLEIGRQLKLAHLELANRGNGTFGKWVKECCGITHASALNQINAWEAFGEKSSSNDLKNIQASALYFLARDTTPEEAIEAAVEQAESGERITLKKAKELVARCEKACQETADAPDASDESEELPDYVKRLQPYESLSDAIEALDAAIAAIYLRWPPEYMAVLGDKLVSLGEELHWVPSLRGVIATSRFFGRLSLVTALV